MPLRPDTAAKQTHPISTRLSIMQSRPIALLFLWTAMAIFSHAEESKFIDFEKHIQPILQENCLKCHGPKDAKNDFRVDERSSLLEYIVPGDADSSSLWTDYLFTEDPDMLMPPASPESASQQHGGLSKVDLLFVRTWINEGADGEWVAETETTSPVIPPTPPASTAQKLWRFQGIFHPAAVHLPVALLSVSAVFVFLSFFSRSSFEPVAYHCLWIGAVGAIAACATGWSYAAHEGYGDSLNLDLEHGIDRHRWAGVFVAGLSCLLIPLSRSVRRTGETKKRIIWLLASLLLIGSVSITGYQGGELTYGEDHYLKYFEEIFRDVHSPESVSDAKLSAR